MKVLILHRIAYPKIVYDNGIDHDAHDVVYVGTADRLLDIPEGLRCRKLAREDLGENVHDAVMAALRGETGFDRVISLSESELLEAAKVRDSLGVSGPGYAQARLVRDKVAMKQAVAAAGLDAPRFVAVSSLEAGAELPWTGKTVLKPTHGAGSEDVVIYPTAQQCLQALATRRTGIPALDETPARPERYELEEFVTGAIIHLDGLVRDGQVQAVLGSRYIGTCQRYNENVPLGSYQFDLDAGVRRWVQRVIDAVQIRCGAFHLEAIESDRGLVFLEIGNRSGGAGVPQATSLAWDANFQKLELELLVGDCSADLSGLQRWGQYYGWYVVPGHLYGQGRWRASRAVDALRVDPRVVRWYERAKSEGFDPKPDYDLASLPFGGIVGAETSEGVRDFMNALFAAIHWERHAVHQQSAQSGCL